MAEQPPWLLWATELQAIAQTGLHFSNNIFDQQRYQRIRELSALILTQYSNLAAPAVLQLFEKEEGYMTPRLDVRGVVFNEQGDILLVRERSDGLWTLPGGWADVNESPAAATVREIFEETGFHAKAVKLLALYDKQKQQHPPQWPHTYKSFFRCEIVGGSAKPSVETSEVSFFAEAALPADEQLSWHRITRQQLTRLFQHYQHPEWPTDFD